METASTIANANDDDKEIEDVEEEKLIVRSDKTFHELTNINNHGKICQLLNGLRVMERVDRMLRALDETAKWSFPTEPEIKLECPLPWILFLAFDTCHPILVSAYRFGYAFVCS